MSVFKSYLRQLIRQLKALQKANKEGNKEEVERIINELLKDAQDGLEDDQEDKDYYTTENPHFKTGQCGRTFQNRVGCLCRAAVFFCYCGSAQKFTGVF